MGFFTYRKILLVVLLSVIFISCKRDNRPEWTPPRQPDEEIGFFTGMDMSYQSFLEDYDVEYLDSNGETISDLFQYIANNGVNLIRVRLFHTPSQSDPVVWHSNLEEVKQLCREIEDSGNNILLDFHYSDTWADPGKQYAPAAWEGLEFGEVNDSVYSYTKYVLNELIQQNTLPYMVQIGNETNPGFIWDYGRLGENYSNMDNFAALVNSAQNAIDEIKEETGKDVYSMVHYAGIEYSNQYFEKVAAAGARFDIIALSWYHLWHTKDIGIVRDKMLELYQNHGKPIMIVETNYPWTLGWNDHTNNWVGEESQLLEGYPATPEGQKKYLQDLVDMVKDIPKGHGLGVVWWAPDLVAFDGAQSTNGSFMENLTTFDFDNRALPVMDVFRNN